MDSRFAGSGLARGLTLAGLVLWSVICLFPLYWLAATSIKSQPDIDSGPYYVPFLDFAPSLASWRYILGDLTENLVSRFFNSLLIGGVATALALASAALALYGLTRCRASIRWPSLVAAISAISLLMFASLPDVMAVRLLLAAAAGLLLLAAMAMWRVGPPVGVFGAITLMLSSRMLPPVTIILPLYMMARAANLLDTRTALILAYTAVNLPVALWLLQPVIGSRATEQEEAAQLDGATHLAILFGILLPMIRGGLAAAGLIVFLLCWNEYLFAAYLTSDHALTLPPWMVGQLSMKEAQAGGEAEELAHLSAAAVLMAIPALAFAAFAHRLLARSLVLQSGG